ncbi:MAG: HDOD domain-containing protein [Desulfatiglans sp.]|jgi:EAL and modified HD-GYP domain-containing signal transduction protein|nr:HDOD domain-containing protein [Desulfatiglans sp.]
MDIYVARQPIFDQKKKIFGYELLFRDSMENLFSGIDGNAATSKVLSNSFFNIGMDKLIGKGVAFINFTEELLVNQVPKLFSSKQLVIEVLEDVKAEKAVVESCIELSKLGYTIALDDFSYSEALIPLIEVADIIKFDFRATPPDEISKSMDKLSKYDLMLLAEKVETHEEFNQALEMGFKYFQGYFFSKPEVIEGRDISPAKINLLQIMAEVNQPDFEFSKVEEIISKDVSLSYKLMRYINSAYYRRVNEISSIKQAILMLGERGIRSFLSLIAMAKLSDNKPDELIRTSVIRAKFCELMARYLESYKNASELFTLGIFSSIDAILDDTMENVMAKLPLSENIKDALIKNTGELSYCLEMAKSYERGDWEQLNELAKDHKVNQEKLPQSFLEAITWADAITET